MAGRHRLGTSPPEPLPARCRCATPCPSLSPSLPAPVCAPLRHAVRVTVSPRFKVQVGPVPAGRPVPVPPRFSDADGRPGSPPGDAGRRRASYFEQSQAMAFTPPVARRTAASKRQCAPDRPAARTPLIRLLVRVCGAYHGIMALRCCAPACLNVLCAEPCPPPPPSVLHSGGAAAPTVPVPLRWIERSRPVTRAL
jgi:hypothetical protein